MTVKAKKQTIKNPHLVVFFGGAGGHSFGGVFWFWLLLEYCFCLVILFWIAFNSFFQLVTFSSFLNIYFANGKAQMQEITITHYKTLQNTKPVLILFNL